MKTAKIELKLDGSLKPYISGNYEFELGKDIIIVDNSAVKEIKFNWCVEFPQNQLIKQQETQYFELLAEQLKQDFIKFLNSKSEDK